MIMTLSTAQYPALDNLKVQPLSEKTSQMNHNHVSVRVTERLKRNWNYQKHQLLRKVLRYILPKEPPNFKANEIIAEYFSYSLNPIYQKISNLPQKIFVCGFCKQLYYGPSEYLLHCQQFNCPVNHDRSTYFFHFKNKFAQIKNSDISQSMSLDELAHFKSISFRKKSFLLAQFNVIPLQQNSSEIIYCGKCNMRFNYRIIMMHSVYIPHCLLSCKSSKISTNSHSLVPIQTKQDLISFVDDVVNLAINFNLITIFDDSYIKIEKNPKYSRKNIFNHFCANCKCNFNNETLFIQHCLFQCKEKTNPKSSHIFLRKIIQKPQSQKTKDQDIPKKLDKKLKTVKQTIPIQKISNKIEEKPWTQKINPDLIQFKDHFNNLYFCGQCNSHFQDDENYLFHCLSSLCPLNQHRNSHLFYEKNSEQALSIKSRESYFSLKKKTELLKNKENPELGKKWKENIEVVDRSTKDILKSGKMDDYHCGKCGSNFKQQQKYIFHCLQDCISLNNEKNSHMIEFKAKREVEDEDFKQFLISYLYGVHIMKLGVNKKFKVTKNIFIDSGVDYLCGKCDTIFGNLYEYVLHSLEVCHNMRCKYSSHFISQVLMKNQSQRIKCPLDIVSCQDFPQKSWDKKKSCSQQLQIEGKIQTQEQIEVQDNSHTFDVENKKNYQEKYEEQNNSGRKRQQIYFNNGANTNNQEINSIRLLRPNIEFKASQKQKYYCGLCQISFKKQQELETHIQECRSFENINSSHLFVTNQRYEQINIGRVLLLKNRKPEPKNIAGINLQEFETYTCGCGKKGPLKNYLAHNKNKHSGKVQKGSSHIILRMIFHSNDQIEPVFLPVNPKGINSEHEFVCPCDPWKKYKYSEFINHIIKRHEGKSPKFWMRFERQN